jgi:hypothetical protein
MPPLSHAPTTVDQQKFVISWLSVVENRLACFGGAGAKAGYGGKSVVKPGTAFNALAQAVNKKFSTSWDGESAKCRVRTMKQKFHKVFTLCAGNVTEETAAWKVSDEDKRDGIYTLADKAQSMCPHWNSWLEWCGNDPNMTKHGAGDSGLIVSIGHGLGDEDRTTGHVNGGRDQEITWSGSGRCSSGDENDDGAEDEDVGDGKCPGSLASFSSQRESQGDAGHKFDDDDEVTVPRPATVTVAKAAGTPGDDDDLLARKQKRKEMLAHMSPEEKKDLSRHEQKEKRQREQDASSNRRNVIAAAASPSSPQAVTSHQALAQSSSSNSVVSPFGKTNKDWQASFLVDRAKDEETRAEKQSAASIAVAKLQVAAADRQHGADLEHKREQLQFQQLQLNFQQQQMQMQMSMQQSQQMMSVPVDVLYLFLLVLQVHANETA